MTQQLSRRLFLQAAPGLIVTQVFWSCAGFGRQKTEFDAKINKKIHWTRRENWPGQEYVYGVAGLGDRYLLVKHRTLGWDFPGGPVFAESHGLKTDENEDLNFAVSSYVHSQALLAQRLGETKLFAYGFGINPKTDENCMIHWFSVGVPNTFLSEPHPNMKDITAAGWITLDDPVLGKCLRMRINEYNQAKEGGTVLKETCFEYSI